MRYVFSNLAQGLRRNLSMHIAVVLTLFVSLTLVGLGVLLQQQAQKAADQWGSQLQITVYLCNDNSPGANCNGEVTGAQKAAIVEAIDASPEVAGYRLESKEEAFEKVKELLGPEKFEGPHPAATAEAMPESIWIELKDPKRFEGVTSAVSGLDGVDKIGDMRDKLKPIMGSLDLLKWVSLGTALFLVVAALLLVANTIRLAALARRREIGIMRLVGASSTYITLPFLLEALVEAVIAVALAGGALGALMYFGIYERTRDSFKFIPWISTPEYLDALLVIGVLGPALTLVPTLILTRFYIKV